MREVKIWLLSRAWHSASACLTSPLSSSLDIQPFLKFRRSGCEAKRAASHSLSFIWMCDGNITNMKTWRNSAVRVHPQVSKTFMEEKKNQRGWTGREIIFYRRMRHTQLNYILLQERSSNHNTAGLLYHCASRQQIQCCRLIFPERT